MIITLMIILIVLSEWLSLVFARERMKYMDLATEYKEMDGDIRDLGFTRIFLANLRIVFAFATIIFWMYALLFIPALLFTIVLNIIVTMITAICLYKIVKKNKNKVETFNKRVWAVRIDSILTLIIWLPHFLPILLSAF